MKLEDYKFEIPNETVNEKDFDLEKWRSETPVDYLKMIQFLITTPMELKEEIFKTVYKITRLYLPKTLYKYYSLTDNINLNEEKFKTLSEKKIFTCEAKYLNDPFDNKAYFYNHNEMKKKYPILNEYGGRIIEDFTSFTKVTALTANKVNSMPMWAHYSNNHQGYCVSYDMETEDNLQLISCTYPVQYTEERIDITRLMIEQMDYVLNEVDIQTSQGEKKILLNDQSLIYLMVLFSNIKHISWNYENEFRCSLGVSDKISSYVSGCPKEIYIGMNCNSTYKNKLKSIGNDLGVPVYQMSFDELSQDFNLVSKS